MNANAGAAAYHRIRRAGYVLRVVEVKGETKLRVSSPPHPAEDLRQFIRDNRDELLASYIEADMIRTETEVFDLAGEFFGGKATASGSHGKEGAA